MSTNHQEAPEPAPRILRPHPCTVAVWMAYGRLSVMCDACWYWTEDPDTGKWSVAL